MKPAEQSSVTAALFFAICEEAGLPAGVLQFLPGPGETVGERLVRHPDVAVVAFTGSRAAGLRIQRLAAAVRGRQRLLKRVLAEMGGKNAVIIDRDADLDQAVPGVVSSAFGYQGQKCSACSRVIVHRRLYKPFLGRLVEAVRSLTLGPPWAPGADLGPLISEEALAKVLRYADLGRSQCRVAYDGAGTAPPGRGFYAPPLILADVDPRSALAQEEIFGPVLCVIPARDFAQAVRIANATPYGLTGGVYTRNPEHLRRAAAELAVGNLYFNRGITGALVDRQPFGGVKLSGVGSKTGGPDHLLQFLQPQTVSEWTVRRGFAPEILGA
jgi:RHH-type proline utilization regulon transcriptional repressor/proline dehydrogenase/delta 1-pyrroline-5-carboxylate dehydrogenase